MTAAMGVVRRLFSRYLLLTNTAITVTLSTLSDGVEQRYEIGWHKLHEKWDYKRAARVAASGLIIGPVCHYWYQFIDKRFHRKTLSILLKKVLVDHVVMTPVTISLFFITVGLLEGSRPKEVINETLEKGTKVFLVASVLYPPAQFLNFSLLPTRYRVLCDNSMSFVFDFYTCYVKFTESKLDELNTDSAVSERIQASTSS